MQQRCPSAAVSWPVEVPALLGDHVAMRWAMNDSMASIFRGIGPALPLEMLPPELASLARAGLLRSEGRVHLAMSQVKSAPPQDFDDYSAERWSNEVHLESQLPPSDPAWRSELVAWGVTVAQRLLRMAPDITGLPIQAPSASSPRQARRTRRRTMQRARSTCTASGPVPMTHRPALISSTSQCWW